jgi:hypothetical protein
VPLPPVKTHLYSINNNKNIFSCPGPLSVKAQGTASYLYLSRKQNNITAVLNPDIMDSEDCILGSVTLNLVGTRNSCDLVNAIFRAENFQGRCMFLSLIMSLNKPRTLRVFNLSVS